MHWVGTIFLGSIASVLISLALIAVDYVRARRGGFLPVGIRAWLSGMLAFAMFAGLYVIFLPMVDNDSFPFGGVRDFYIMVLASIPASAVFARLALGGSERTFPELRVLRRLLVVLLWRRCDRLGDPLAPGQDSPKLSQDGINPMTFDAPAYETFGLLFRRDH